MATRKKTKEDTGVLDTKVTKTRTGRGGKTVTKTKSVNNSGNLAAYKGYKKKVSKTKVTTKKGTTTTKTKAKTNPYIGKTTVKRTKTIKRK